jgi:hypothetical protein
MTQLTQEQISRIEYLACDEWVVDTGAADDESRSWQNFNGTLQLMSAIELHHFACNFNWDCGAQELEALVDHCECDAGTALMVYWLGQPAEHYRMQQSGSLSPDANNVVALLRKIETKFENNEFKTQGIACDPMDIMGQPMTSGSERDREVVPGGMFNTIDGVSIEPHQC